MLKPLLFAKTATIFRLVVPIWAISAATVVTATPASHYRDALSTEVASTQIAKEDNSGQISARQQSDVQSIHKTLTQFYRGLNEYNIDRMAAVAVSASNRDKAFLRSQFARFKAAGISVIVEVKNIELVSLSDRDAIVKIEQLITAKSSQGTANYQQVASVTLIKDGDRWKVGGSSSAAQALERYR